MKIPSNRIFVLIGAFTVFTLIAGAAIFQPWKLFIDTEVQEQIPTVQESPAEIPGASDLEIAPSEAAQPGESAAATPEPSDAQPVILAQGSLISHEYATSGTVKILKLADGSRVLRLENLDTTDGPKVEVWLSDAPVIEGKAGWFVFGDSNYQSLGALKGNKGNQNYAIPADLDLSDFSSVSLWCVTFSVSFAAAELIK